MPLESYTYIFAIGTFFAIFDAYNNGASKLCRGDDMLRIVDP